jgi:hypothetical protein
MTVQPQMSSFKVISLIYKMLFSRSEDFDYWLRQLPHDKKPGDDELTYMKCGKKRQQR